MRTHLNFSRVNEIEAMYGTSLAQFLRNARPFIDRLYFIYARKSYATVEIHPTARQFFSSLRFPGEERVTLACGY